jgi:protein SCO1
MSSLTVGFAGEGVCDNRGMISVRSKLIWTLAAVGAALAGFWLARELHSTGPQLASGTWLSPARQIGEFSLTDEAGQPFTRANMQGRPSLVFFGFTHCPDVCPTTLAMLAQANKAAGIEGLRTLLITVDPARDTPQVLEKYVHAFDRNFSGVTGSQAVIERLEREFSVAARRIDLPGGDYTMDHSAAVFLLDDQVRIVGIFTPPFDARQIAADLRRAAPRLSS